MSNIIEGVWDCRYCGAKKIRGAFRECPSCGHPRDSTVKFYLDNPNNFVDDETAKNLNQNPDWVCRFCECLNSDDNTHCIGCGAERTEACEDYFTQQRKNEEAREQQLRQAAERLTLQSEELMQSAADEAYDEMASFAEDPPLTKREKRQRFWGIFATVLLILALIGGIVWLCLPKTVEGVVSNFSWERTIAIEEYKTVREQDWSIPPGGTYVSESIEIKSYVQVIDHYETKTRTYTVREFSHYETKTTYKDMGNGYFKTETQQVPVYKNVTKTETYQEPVYRNEPVFATKYTYDIDKWVYERTAKAEAQNHNPEWPELHLEDNQRQGSKGERYTVTIIVDNETKSYTMSYEEWAVLQSGQTVRLQVDVTGHASIINDD